MELTFAGVNLFVIVIEINRFTEEGKQAVEVISKFFGNLKIFSNLF